MLKKGKTGTLFCGNDVIEINLYCQALHWFNTFNGGCSCQAIYIFYVGGVSGHLMKTDVSPVSRTRATMFLMRDNSQTRPTPGARGGRMPIFQFSN